MASESITVIVVGWDGDPWLPDCLASLATASRQRMRLVMVDNKNNPCLADLDLSAFETRIIQTPEPLGFAAANNFGLLQGGWQEGLVLFLNQDTKSSPGWIDICVDCFELNPNLGILSPAIRTYDDKAWDPAFETCRQEVFPGGDPSVQLVKEVTAAAMFIRGSVLAESGPFDPIFESYYEDYDLCQRVRNAGFDVGICLDACIFHSSGSITRDPAAERRRMRWVARNRIIARIREAGPARLRALLKCFCYTIPRNLGRGLVGRPTAQPVGVTLAVMRDLIRLAPRLASRAADERAWRRYLVDIGW